MPLPFHGIEVRGIGGKELQDNDLLLRQIALDHGSLMPFGVVHIEPDSRMIRVTIRYPSQKRYEVLCISFGNLVHHRILGVHIYNATQVHPFPGAVREQLRLASSRRPLGGDGGVQLNARFIGKEDRFLRLLIQEFFLDRRETHPVAWDLLGDTFCALVVPRTQWHEAN